MSNGDVSHSKKQVSTNKVFFDLFCNTDFYSGFGWIWVNCAEQIRDIV